MVCPESGRRDRVGEGRCSTVINIGTLNLKTVLSVFLNVLSRLDKISFFKMLLSKISKLPGTNREEKLSFLWGCR